MGEITSRLGYPFIVDDTKVDIREAETNFARVANLIREGRIITLLESNQPLAEIRPIPHRPQTKRPFGLARGSFSVPDDFGRSDREKIEKMFYGGA